jgi:hypothetical protein
MNKLFALTLLLLSSFPLLAQDILVDDFTTASSPILMYRDGDKNVTSWLGDPNHLIGGVRDFNVQASGNRAGQISTFQFRPDLSPGGNSMYIHNAAFYAFPRTEICYGCTNALQLDLTSYRNDPNGVLRFRFKGLTANLNFNVVLYDAAHGHTRVGCGVPSAANDFVLDIPVSQFTNTIDFASVAEIVVVTQSNSPVGGVTFGISSIKFSTTPDQGAYVCGG